MQVVCQKAVRLAEAAGCSRLTLVAQLLDPSEPYMQSIVAASGADRARASERLAFLAQELRGSA